MGKRGQEQEEEVVVVEEDVVPQTGQGSLLPVGVGGRGCIVMELYVCGFVCMLVMMMIDDVGERMVKGGRGKRQERRAKEIVPPRRMVKGGCMRCVDRGEVG